MNQTLTQINSFFDGVNFYLNAFLTLDNRDNNKIMSFFLIELYCCKLFPNPTFLSKFLKKSKKEISHLFRLRNIIRTKEKFTFSDFKNYLKICMEEMNFFFI